MTKSSTAACGPRGLSLNAVAHILRTELGLGHAPSRITMHRHSQKGELSEFVVRQTASRKLYDADKVLAYYKRSLRPAVTAAASAAAQGDNVHNLGAAPGAHTDAPPGAAISQVLAPILDALTETRREVAALQRVGGELMEAIRDIKRDVGALQQIRNSLMLKYDAVAALQQQKIDDLSAKVAQFKESSSMEVTLTKLRIDIGHLTNLVEARSPAR